jgi:hypothetical protein
MCTPSIFKNVLLLLESVPHARDCHLRKLSRVFLIYCILWLTNIIGMALHFSANPDFPSFLYYFFRQLLQEPPIQFLNLFMFYEIVLMFFAWGHFVLPDISIFIICNSIVESLKAITRTSSQMRIRESLKAYKTLQLIFSNVNAAFSIQVFLIMILHVVSFSFKIYVMNKSADAGKLTVKGTLIMWGGAMMILIRIFIALKEIARVRKESKVFLKEMKNRILLNKCGLIMRSERAECMKGLRACPNLQFSAGNGLLFPLQSITILKLLHQVVRWLVFVLRI